MICPHCQTEQSDDNLFCTDCGRELGQDGRVAPEEEARSPIEEPSISGGDSPQSEGTAAETAVIEEDDTERSSAEPDFEAAARGEQSNNLDTESAHSDEADSSVDRSKQSTRPAAAGFTAMRLGRHLLLPLISAAVTAGLSIALGAWMASSQFIDAWIYRLYHDLWGWGQAASVAAADSYGWSWWHVLAQMHGSEIETAWRAASSDEGGYELVYGLQLPLLGLLLVALLSLIIIHKAGQRMMRRRGEAGEGTLSRIAGVVGQAVLYGLLAALLLLIFRPGYDWEGASPLADLVMRESVPFLSAWWKASMLYAVASAAALVLFRSGGKERQNNGIPALGGGLRLLVRWGALVCAVMLIIGLMMPLVWALSDSMSFYEQPPASIAHQWQTYGADPAMLAGMPTFLVQEWLYATGGTVHLQGSMMADVLRLQPLSLHIVKGLSVDSLQVGEPSSAVIALAAAARGNWHVWSMLLLTVYGTFRLAARSQWLEIVVFAIGAGIAAAAAAQMSAIGIGMLEASDVQRLGHNPLFAAIQIAVVSFIAAAAGKLWTARFGVNRKTSEVRTDGE